jgi:L-Ala-D/L-Glu epimerase
MKIKNILVWKKDLGNKRPYTIAFKTVSDVAAIFVQIQLEEGLYGLGAGNPSQQVVLESLEDTENALTNNNLDFLLGRDIREFYTLLKEVQERMPKTPAARAAVDIALHDAFTKFLKVPLVTFLGQKIESLETSVTIGIKSVEDTLEEALEYHDLGFRILKVKTGHSVDVDIERMAKLKETFGKEMLIRVDANQGYSREDLEKFYHKTIDMEIELIEQPVKAEEVALMKSLPDDIKKIIAADESLKSPYNAFELANAPAACGIFNIKLMKSGGVYPALQIAEVAQFSNTELMWGCNDESAISISAALHAALSSPQTRYLDLDGSLDLEIDMVRGGFTIENGFMRVTDAPGLGVEFLEENM